MLRRSRSGIFRRASFLSFMSIDRVPILLPNWPRGCLFAPFTIANRASKFLISTRMYALQRSLRALPSIVWRLWLARVVAVETSLFQAERTIAHCEFGT